VKHSLRLRLTLACLALLAAGLAGVGVVTYEVVQSYLVNRVDQQLSDRASGAEHARFLTLDGGGMPGNFGGGGPRFLRNTLIFGIIDPSGKVIGTTPGDISLKDLPKGLPGSTADPSTSTSNQRSFDFSIGSASYRGLAVPKSTNIGTVTLAFALPLRDVNSTLDEILLAELVVGGIALVAVGIATWVIVRRGLRPLERMAQTATVIAGGDLSQRVDEGDRESEVGQLGVAFNGMLTQIEAEIAERRASEERLRRFAADASHELRTPLTSIRGYAELFRRGAADRPEDLALTMQRIESEAIRMTSLVDDLLLLARLDRGRPLARDRVDVGRLVHDVVAGQRVVHTDREYRLNVDDVVLLGDEARLRQVLLNLVSNAANHTPGGTPIDLTVRRENGEAVIEVADHGDGLSKEDAERVFERFFRVDSARVRGDGGGSGLGLAIVSAIVDAHGGRVEVDSIPGQGARFRVRLPATEPVRPRVSEPASATPVEA
jgi:two-component system OmpR family sensor kinase